MIPTFLGVTLVAFSVMQVASSNAYVSELQQFQGGSENQEGGATSGTGDRDQDSAISLEQIERLKRRFELHLPIVINTDVLDRSEQANHALDTLLADVPDLNADSLIRVLDDLKQDELKKQLEDYLEESKQKDLPWNFDDSFASTFSISLGAIDFQYQDAIQAVWENFEKKLAPRKEFRQRRDKALRDLNQFKERLIPTLIPQTLGEPNSQKKELALSYLSQLPQLENVDSLEKLDEWWDARQSFYSEEMVGERARNLVRLTREEADYQTQMAQFRQEPSLYARAFFEIYEELDSLNEKKRALLLFEEATGADTIPYVDVLDEEHLDLSRAEALKWWRDHELQFVEIGNFEKYVIRTFTETRYGGWLRDLIHLDLRESRYLGIPVMQAIKERLPISIQFGLTGFFISYLVCIPLGILKAIRHNSTFDFETSFLIFIGYSIPGWALGAILLMNFGGESFMGMKIPLYGFVSENYDELGFWEQIKDRIAHSIFPISCYSITLFATTTVLMKNSLMENLGADYVRTAFAKGLNERRVIFVHTLRNSLIPLCVGIGHTLSLVLAGSYFIERVFTIDGFGFMGFQALINNDVNLLMGVLVIGAALRLWGNLFSDILYSLVDPRVRFR